MVIMVVNESFNTRDNPMHVLRVKTSPSPNIVHLRAPYINPGKVPCIIIKCEQIYNKSVVGFRTMNLTEFVKYFFVRARLFP